MKLRWMAMVVALVGSALFSSCNGGGGGGGAADTHVRLFLRDTLGPFLDSLTHQFCRVRQATAPTVGQGNDICKDIFPDGYKPPPRNGGP